MTREIPLTKGFVAIVDDDMFEYLNQWPWHYHSEGYAVRHQHKEYCPVRKRSFGKNIFMHNQIIKVPKGMLIDHKDRNGLLNTRDNLQTVTPSHNSANTGKAAGTSSKYKGVSRYRIEGKWQVQLMVKGIKIKFPIFDCEIEAAKAYNAEKRKHYAENCYLNTFDD